MPSLRSRYFDKPKKEVQVVAGNAPLPEINEEIKERSDLAGKIEEKRLKAVDPVMGAINEISQEGEDRRAINAQEQIDATVAGLKGVNDEKIRQKMINWIKNTANKYNKE